VATLYCVPVAGSIQNEGEVWKLPDSDTSMIGGHIALSQTLKLRIAAVDVHVELG